MNWATQLGMTAKWVGLIVFFLVPLAIWIIVFLIARKKNQSFKFFGLIVGSDNRLSLARLQALAWTLVIFGSYFAAMGVHKPIDINAQAEADRATEQAKIAESKVKSLATALEIAKTKMDNASKEKSAADKALNDAKSNKEKIDANANSTPEEKEAANTDVARKTEELAVKTQNQNRALQDFEEVQKSVSDAEKSAQTAKENAGVAAETAFSEKWVDIPLELLALAGIALGSVGFSSLISAVSGEDKTAEITNVDYISSKNFNDEAKYPKTFVSRSDNLLRIVGNNFGSKKGKVRMGKDYSLSQTIPVLFWNENGSEIIVDVTTDIRDILIVDTINGKLTYNLKNIFNDDKNQDDKILKEKAEQTAVSLKNKEEKEKELSEAKAVLNTIPDDDANKTAREEAQAKVDAAKTDFDNAVKNLEDSETELKKYANNTVRHLSLGKETFSYEFADLFRDDKNPANLDLMKFQMFGWTLIAIFIYSWLFLQNLNDNITTLPLVPQTIVLLTGLSQTGYLAGKGVSSIPGKEEKKE